MRKAVPFQDVGQTLHSKVHKLFTLYSVFMALTVQLSPAHSNWCRKILNWTANSTEHFKTKSSPQTPNVSRLNVSFSCWKRACARKSNSLWEGSFFRSVEKTITTEDRQNQTMPQEAHSHKQNQNLPQKRVKPHTHWKVTIKNYTHCHWQSNNKDKKVWLENQTATEIQLSVLSWVSYFLKNWADTVIVIQQT